MGNQQILLLVLSTVLVGAAVALGLALADESAADLNRDALMNDLQHLAAMAQGYYRTPAVFGGGGNSFEGFTTFLRNANGRYEITDRDPAVLVFRATGVEDGRNGRALEVKMTVTPSNVSLHPAN